MSGNLWVAIGSVSASIAVAAGAIGAHVLKSKLEPQQLETFETAVRYQMFHAFGLILLGLIVFRGSHALLTTTGVLFIFGTLLFSGGIYAWLATAQKPFVMIVPIGGTAWIVAWLLLAAAVLRKGA